MIPLKQIHIPTPCHESWEAMDGDAQQRLCAGCRKHVHNLSEMTRDEAQDVINRAEGHVCVRFFPGADGRPLTREDLTPAALPVTEVPAFPTRGRRRLAAAASWAVALLTAGLGFAQAAVAPKTAGAAKAARSPHRYKLGQFTVPKPNVGAPKPARPARPGFDSGPAPAPAPTPTPPPAMMGFVMPAPAPPPPAPRAMMGDIALPPAAMGEMAPTPTPRK